MPNNEILVTVASWEPRFWLGFQKVTTTHIPREVFMYFYSEYSQLSEPNREKVRKFCGERQVRLHEDMLSFSAPTESWRTLYTTITEAGISGQRVLVDITTMPRETTWILFDLLDPAKNSIDWVYHKPESYNDDWLSRDPGKPRFVPKMGGVVELGLPTRLLILTGFDTERTKQLIIFYEPELILLGFQTGSQFDNVSQNADKHFSEFGRHPLVSLFPVDAYSNDQGLSVVSEKIIDQLGDSNLIMASLGPKPSAVALYHIHKAHPETSLAYAPSKEFNPNYSRGLGESILGHL